MKSMLRWAWACLAWVLFSLPGVLMASTIVETHSPHILIPSSLLTMERMEPITSGGVLPTTATSADAHPDIPVPDSSNSVGPTGSPDFRLLATGGYGPQGSSFTVATVQGGHTNELAEVGFSDDGGTTWVGADSVSVPTSWETIIASTGSGYRRPRATGLPDGKVIVVAEDWSGVEGVRTYVRSAGSAGTWASGVDVWTNTTGANAFTATRHPCPDVLYSSRPDGSYRIYVVSMMNHVFDTDYTYVAIHYSDDSGATWAMLSPRALRLDPTAYDYSNLRVEYIPTTGSWVLTVGQDDAGTYSVGVAQSHNGGQSFGAVRTLTMPVGAETHDLVLTSSALYIYTVGENGAGDLTLQRFRMTVGSGAFTTTAYVMPRPSTGGVEKEVDTAHVAVVVDSGQHIHAYARQADAIGIGWYWRDLEDPYQFAKDKGTVTATLGTGQYWESGVWADNVVYLLGGQVSTLGTPYTNSVTSLLLGSLSSVTVESTSSDEILLPIDTGAASGWTSTGAGTETITTVGGALLRQVSTTANTRYWADTASGTSTRVARFGYIDVNSGGSTTSDDVSLMVSATGTGGSCKVTLRMSTTAVRAYDNYGASYYATATTVTYPIQALVVLDADAYSSEGRVSIYVRSVGTDRWTAIVEGGVATHGAAASTVEFGHRSSGTASSDWGFIGLGSDQADNGIAAGDNDTAPLPSPYLKGVGVNIEPTLLYRSEQNEVRVFGSGGPTSIGDQWTITSTSTLGWANIQPGGVSYSPQSPWTSGTIVAGSDQVFVWDLEDAGAREETFGDVVAMALYNCNAASAKVQRYSGGAWVDILSLDLSEVLCTDWALDGHTLRPTQAAVGRYIDGTDPVGCVVKITDSTGDVIYRRVAYADHGQAGSGGKPWRLHLEPEILSGTWTSVGSSSTGGSSEVKIYWRSGIRVAAGPTDGTRYLRLSFTGNPVETFITAGLFHFGRVMTLPDVPGPASSYGVVVNDEVTASAGVVSARRLTAPQRQWLLTAAELKVHKQHYSPAPSVTLPSKGDDSTPRVLMGTTIDLQAQLMEEVGSYRQVSMVPTAPSAIPYTMVGGVRPSRFAPGRLAPRVGANMASGLRFNSISTSIGVDDMVYDTDGLGFTEDV